MTSYRGVSVTPGRVIGRVRTMAPAVAEPSPAALPEGADRDAEAQRIAEAADVVRRALTARARLASGPGRAVLEATAAIAADPQLLSTAQDAVRQRGVTPERAVWEAAEQMADLLTHRGGRMAERAADVHDVRGRLIAALRGEQPPGIPEASEPYVLLAADLAPADAADLDPQQVIALVTAGGGPQSHTAILARHLGIPAIVAADGALGITPGTDVFVDAAHGQIHDHITPAHRSLAAACAHTRPLRYHGGAHLADGPRIPLLANVGDLDGAREAAALGADGIGLLRTEVLFLDRATEPSVAEQVAAYSAILALFPHRPVVVRTLDAGADKPLPFLAAAGEPNPALGLRGWRTTRHHPDVLRRQLDAIAAAARRTSADVHVMVPMIATAEETREALTQIRAAGLARAGITLETPAAALTAGRLLASADFASIGTNDLTQYTMAADRMLGELAALNDPWQPAVLELIATAIRGAGDVPVGVCGEAAGDPALAVVLVGLGAAALSMAPRALGPVARVLGEVSADQARRLADHARMADGAYEAREAVRTQLPLLEELGL